MLLIVLIVTLSLSAGQPADPRAEISSLRYHQHPAFLRIVLEINQVREFYSAELKAPERFYLDVFQARLSPALTGKTLEINSGCARSMRLAQKNPSTVRLAIDLIPGMKAQQKIYYLKNPNRLVIDLYHKEGASLPEKPKNLPAEDRQTKEPPAGNQTAVVRETPPSPPQPTSSGYTIVRQLGLGVKRIVLDPGHGGSDPGCLGVNGLKEKDVALDIALRLKRILETEGKFEVILTRDRDITLPLEKRTAIANQKNADLFISIHLNASPRKNRTGVETFYLNFSPDPAVNELAALENASSNKNIREIKFIVEKIMKNTKYDESKELAEKIHHHLYSHLKQHFGPRDDLGVKGGPFWVLIGTDMPAVLVEASHLSNSKEAESLKTDMYRESIATGIFRGIIEYVKSLGKG
ncbi:MAG: N-acetylmuramoyl-L-alanine amidase [Candidatus Saccharicenans sp.]